METLRFFRDYLLSKYGRVLQRIPFDLGLSCPNRHPDGSGGCVFCSPDGGRARHLERALTLREQAERGIEYARTRYGAEAPYIAYFQAFTSTNADPATLESLYREALSFADFKVVIIGTRPDCVSDECIDLLKRMNKQREVWVELGVQTFNDQTLELIGRGHDSACSADCARRLDAAGIHVAAHMILGLPHETESDMLRSASRLAELPFSGVKFHNLLILKGTRLASMKGTSTLDEYAYASILAKAVKLLPERCLLMRLTSEADESELIAPHWWMKKGQFLDFFKAYFENDGAGGGRFLPVETADGTHTLYHPVYKQHFHSVAGASLESEKKYIEPSDLAGLLSKGGGPVLILDVGFGLGCNTGAALRCAANAGAKVSITTLELDPKVITSALTLPENTGSPLLEALRDTGRYCSENGDVTLLTGDARQTVLTLDNGVFDIVFLDGFSPDVNPELWTFDFISELKRVMKPSGVLTTYSSAYPLIGALLALGFTVYRSVPFGRRRGGVAAALTRKLSLEQLSEKDANITLLSTAGTPYRDETLSGTGITILDRHKSDILARRASGVPKWYK